MTQSYKDLIVWKKSMDLVKNVYLLTSDFPKEEIFGLTSQMRRCAISIPSNIAEGKLRGYDKELKRFLLISFGSGGELETQIEIAKSLYENKNINFNKVDECLLEVMKMLNQFINKLEPSA